MARSALFITPYWIDLCNQRLPSCLEVHPHRCVSRSFKREIDRRKLLSPQMIRLAPRCTAPGRYRHAPRLADERRHPTLHWTGVIMSDPSCRPLSTGRFSTPSNRGLKTTRSQPKIGRPSPPIAPRSVHVLDVETSRLELLSLPSPYDRFAISCRPNLGERRAVVLLDKKRKRPWRPVGNHGC